MQGRSETGRSCGGGSTVNPRHRSRIARSHRSRPRHSGSIFRAIGVRPSQTGTTPVEFVKRRRLREALLLLQRSDLINLFVAEAPLGVPMADPKKPLEILRVIHSFDPCLACATHVIGPDGQLLTEAKIL